MSPRQLALQGHRQRRGAVLIVALVCLSISTALMMHMTRHALEARRQGRLERQLRQTHYLLEAGVQRAVAAAESADDYNGELWDVRDALPAFDTAEVEIRVAQPSDTAGQRQVTVSARLGRSETQALQTQRSYTFTQTIAVQTESPALESP